MPDTISPTSNQVLQALFNAHGYEATVQEEHVVVRGCEAQMSGEVFLRSQTAPFQLQLDVRVHLPDGRTLVESFAGIGESRQSAMGDGFDNFSRSSFHVLLRAFFNQTLDKSDLDKSALDRSDEEMCEEWQLPGGRFTAWIGNATFRGQPPVQGEELVRWFDSFAGCIQQAPLSPRQSHWIRLYYAAHRGQTMQCEVLLDNRPWEELQREMAGYPWPQGEAFYSTRLFLVLLPISP